MSNIITADYNGTQVFFQDDAYLNATAIAAHFNKKPIEWLRLPSTEEYINTLCEKAKVEKSHFVKTTRGGSNLALRGTWLHRRLAVPFARWLNVEFAIWCDEQIEKILIGQKQQQLALPEPEKTYPFEHSESDLQNLAWDWFALFKCVEFTKDIVPALDAIQSKFAPQARSIVSKYGSMLHRHQPLIQKLTAQFEIETWGDENWNRVLPTIRDNAISSPRKRLPHHNF